jgi:hypothetical protein
MIIKLRATVRSGVGGAREFSAFAFFAPQKNQKNISPAHKNRAIDHR